MTKLTHSIHLHEFQFHTIWKKMNKNMKKSRWVRTKIHQMYTHANLEWKKSHLISICYLNGFNNKNEECALRMRMGEREWNSCNSRSYSICDDDNVKMQTHLTTIKTDRSSEMMNTHYIRSQCRFFFGSSAMAMRLRSRTPPLLLLRDTYRAYIYIQTHTHHLSPITQQLFEA